MGILGWIVGIATYTPQHCRWSPSAPPKFTFALTLLFAVAATVTVANLYYNHPILNRLADDFDVSYERVSNIPTLMQAGYAGGLLLLNPLGDVLRRRLMVLGLIAFTAACWIGLCLTTRFAVFEALSFVTAFTTVSPQIFLPLVGDLAPPEKRATALSWVTSGLLLGMLLARILSGIVTEFVGWRVIYWIAFGLQVLMFALLWLFMPDYPRTNTEPYNFFRSLYSMVQLVARHPILVQSAVVGAFVSSVFTLYWTTLVFLLAAAPYHYNSLVIGLFGLIGVAGICLGPLTGRFIIAKHHTHLSVFLGLSVLLAGQLVGAYAGTVSVAGPVVQALLLDLGIQCAQVSNRTAIYRLDPRARNRLNSVYMLAVFCGQILGTSSGAPVYQRWGWVASGSLGVGYVGAAFLVLALRGPKETRWIGWRGGWDVRTETRREGGGDVADELSREEKAEDRVRELEEGVGESAAHSVRHESEGSSEIEKVE